MLPLILAGAAIGGLLGGLSTYNSSKKEQEALDWQRAQSAAAYGYKQSYDDSMWNLQRTQSLENLGIQKNRLAEAFNADMESFNLGLEGQGLQNQAALISLADSKGMALAQQGASGVRGSGALQRRIEAEEGQFSRQLDLQEKSNSLSLRGMARQYSNQFDDIGREIDSWNSGGYRTEAKSLSDAYAADMYGLQMKGYAQAIEDAEAGPLDYLAGIFGGASSGASFGYQLGGMLERMGEGTQGDDAKNTAGKDSNLSLTGNNSGFLRNNWSAQYGKMGESTGRLTGFPEAYSVGFQSPMMTPRLPVAPSLFGNNPFNTEPGNIFDPFRY